MRARSFSFNPPTNPFLQALYFVGGGVLLIAAIIMGAVLLAVGLGVAIVAGLIIYIRIWWMQRQFARTGATVRRKGRGPGSAGEVLEVEYTVVAERDASGRDDSDRRD